MYITSREEHVPEIEQYIRNIKEWVRYQKLPAKMTPEMAYSTVFLPNSFPNQNGISESTSPRKIM